MDDLNNRSRTRKMEKRRKNTKFLSILIIFSGVLLFTLLAFWIFGGEDGQPKPKSPATETAKSKENVINNVDTQNELKIDGSNLNDSEGTIEDEATHHLVEIMATDPSDDNVVEAYTGNWSIIETVQEGPHTTDYTKGSKDRIEIKEGIMQATDLNENLVEWRIENGGDQKVIATVSDSDEEKVYRVYLSWIENQGWQPTKVELLKTNDKK